MPDGFAYTGSGLPYIPDISLPAQLQPTTFQIPAMPAQLQPVIPYIPTLATTMPETPSGLPYIPDIDLPAHLQPETLSGLTYIPNVSLPKELQPAVPEAMPSGYGPLELVGDIAKGAVDVVGGVAKGTAGVVGEIADTLWSTGKWILEHLEARADIAGQIGGVSARIKQAEAQKTAAEAQKIMAEAYKLKTLAAEMAEPVIVPTVPTLPTEKQPLTYITPETGEAPNYMLYIGVGLLAFILLLRK